MEGRQINEERKKKRKIETTYWSTKNLQLILLYAHACTCLSICARTGQRIRRGAGLLKLTVVNQIRSQANTVVSCKMPCIKII